MTTQAAFTAAVLDGVKAYPWSADAAKLSTFKAKLAETLSTGRAVCAIDGPAFVAAWRSIGGKGKPTLKALAALPAADVESCGSSFGGGWAFGLTDAGTAALEELTGESAFPLAPHGGRFGWIIEPQDAADLFESFAARGLTVTAG